MRKVIITICVILIILLGILFGILINQKSNNKISNDFTNNIENNKSNLIISTVEVTAKGDEEKTTPNTLLTYKTYYTKCKHFITNYVEIDASLVNLTEDELKEKNREWKIESFSSQEVIFSKEEEKFCNEHYKLILENNVIVVYNVDENGKESEYEQTGITTEYLTEEDILKLTTGIIIYGKENLTSVIEDYE